MMIGVKLVNDGPIVEFFRLREHSVTFQGVVEALAKFADWPPGKVLYLSLRPPSYGNEVAIITMAICSQLGQSGPLGGYRVIATEVNGHWTFGFSLDAEKFRPGELVTSVPIADRS